MIIKIVHTDRDFFYLCTLVYVCLLSYFYSSEEAGRYLETYKVYENKPPDALLGQSEGDYLSKVIFPLFFVCLQSKVLL